MRGGDGLWARVVHSDARACACMLSAPPAALIVCSHVLARCLHAAWCWAVCVAMAGESLSWRAGWVGGVGLGGLGPMWCSLMRVHVHAISPACVLVVCSHVLSRYPHAAQCSAVCVAMAEGR